MDIDKFGTFRQSPEHLLPFILSTKFLCWRLIWSNSIYVAFEVTQFTSNDINGIIRNGQLIKWMLIKYIDYWILRIMAMYIEIPFNIRI